MSKTVKMENGKPIKIDQVEDVLQEFKEEVKESRKNKPKVKSKLRTEWLNKALQEDLIKKYAEPLKLISERYNGIIFLYEINKLKDFENKAMFEMFFNINALNRKAWDGKSYYILTSTVSRILAVPKVKDTPQTVKKQYVLNQLRHGGKSKFYSNMNPELWIRYAIQTLKKNQLDSSILESNLNYMTLRRKYFTTAMLVKNIENGFERNKAKGLYSEESIENWETVTKPNNNVALLDWKRKLEEADKTNVFSYQYKKNKKSEPITKYVCVDDLEHRNIFFSNVVVKEGQSVINAYYLDVNNKIDISKIVEIYKFVDDFLNSLGIEHFRLHVMIDGNSKNVNVDEMTAVFDKIDAKINAKELVKIKKMNIDM